MKGSIRQRSKGSWTIIVDLPKDPQTGKRHQQWHTVHGTKKDAERALRELLHSVEKGYYVKLSKVSMAEFLEEWLQGYVELNCSPRTKASYEMIIRRHIIPELGGIPLSQLDPAISWLSTAGRKCRAVLMARGS